MELKLNIYNRKQIEKTYTTEAYDLMFGTVEDLIDIIDLDQLKTGTDAEIIKLVGNMVMKGMDIIKPLLLDVFDGLTEEELKRTRVSEIANVLVNIVKFSLNEMSKGATGKN